MAEEQKKEEKAGKARRPQAQKRIIQGEKRNLRNRAFKAKVSTALRSFHAAKGTKEEKQKHLNEIFSLADKGVKTGILKQKKASRIKARYHQKVAAL